MTTQSDTLQGVEPNVERRPRLDERTLHAMTPSAKLVLTVLDNEGALTQQELATETRLPQRTVRETSRRLEEDDVLERRVYIPDARQFRYTLLAELP